MPLNMVLLINKRLRLKKTETPVLPALFEEHKSTHETKWNQAPTLESKHVTNKDLEVR